MQILILILTDIIHSSAGFMNTTVCFTALTVISFVLSSDLRYVLNIYVNYIAYKK